MTRTILTRLGWTVAGTALFAAMVAMHRVAPEAAHTALAATLVAATGLFVWRRAPGQALNGVFALLALSVVGYLLVVVCLILGAHVGVARIEPAVRILRNGNLLLPFAFMSFLCLFLERRGPLWQVLRWAALVSMSPFIVLNALGLYITEYRLISPSPKLVPHENATLYFWCSIITFGWAFFTAATVAVCAVRDRNQQKRVQYLAFLVGWLFLLLPSLLGFLPAFDVGWYPSFLGWSAAVFPIVLGLAIARLSLFDIRLVIRRTIPYAISMGTLGVLSGLLVILLRHYMLLDVDSTLGQGLLLVFLAFLFQPVFEVSKTLIDQIFFRTEAELDKALARLAVVSCLETTPARLANIAAQEIKTALAVEWCTVVLAEGSLRVEGHAGEAPDSAAHAECEGLDVKPRLTHQTAMTPDQKKKCLLVVGEKRSHQELAQREREFLASVAAQALGGYARLQSSHEAAEARWMTSMLLQMLAVPACVVTRNGTFVVENAAFGDSPDMRAAALAHVATGDAEASQAREIQLSDRHYLMSTRPFQMQQQEAYLILLNDVTELHQLRKEAQQSEALAQLGAAVSSINHEIQNILTPVRIFVSRLTKDLDLESRTRFGRMAAERIDLLVRLTEELRDFYRQPDLQKQMCSLQDTVQSVLQDLSQSGKVIYVPPRLAGLELQLEADPLRLRQILMNLMQNALHAMESVERPAWSLSASETEAGEVMVQLEDCGTGIPPEQLGRVFDPFYSTKKDRGTGLGLAIVRRLVEAHHGRIQIESKVGHGTVVTLCLPVGNVRTSLPEESCSR